MLVEAVLAIILPTEDLENGCLTSLVGQIFSEMILGNGISGKASEPWMLWEGITKVAQVTKTKLPHTKAQKRADMTANTNLEKAPEGTEGWIRRIRLSAQKWFWLVLQYAFTAFISIRFIIVTIAKSSSLPPRNPPYTALKRPSIQPDAPKPTSSSSSVGGQSIRCQPLITMRIWSCVSNLLDLDRRMPWVGGSMSLLQWAALRGPGVVGVIDGSIDKYVSHNPSEFVPFRQSALLLRMS